MDTISAVKRAAAATEYDQRDPPGAGTRAWHTLSVDEVARALQTDPASGLTNAEATRRLGQFGPNALAEAKGRSVLAILMDQFKGLIVALLLATTVVAFALGENIEAVAVLIVIVLNAAVGFLTEWKAEQALTGLQRQPSAPDVMKRPPRDPREPLMTPPFVWLVGWQGMLLSGVTLLAFFLGMRWYGTEGPGLRHATTLSFMTLALAQVFHAFNARSPRRSAFTARLFPNGWLWAAVALCALLQAAAVYGPFPHAVLHTAPLTGADWGVVLACALAPVGMVELVKLSRRVSGQVPARAR